LPKYRVSYTFTLPVETAVYHFSEWSKVLDSAVLKYVIARKPALECAYCAAPVKSVETVYFQKKDKKPELVFHSDEGTKFTVDHITARSKGGSRKMDNLCLACEPCNLAKGNYCMPKITLSQSYAASLVGLGMRVSRRFNNQGNGIRPTEDLLDPRYKRDLLFLSRRWPVQNP